MSTIATVIRIQDSMSQAMRSMSNSLNIVLSSFEQLQRASSNSVDTTSIQTARNELARANASIQQVSENIKNANTQQQNLNNQINNTSNAYKQAETSSNSFLQGLMKFSIVQRILGMIFGQIESALNRLDTLNNFPKVMSNLGIGSEQAEASIQMLSDKLTGLPTKLNDAASSVQKFTAVNNNIGKSTKMFLALNNAILAGGGTTQIQQSALEQLSQAYAKGKPDMVEWRTAMTAMPAQLNQVAKAMGYVNANALGNNLRAGKVSMQEFMDKFIELNEKGTNGFASFEEQAKNATGGFATSIENMKSAITRGITSIVDSINEALTNAGFGTIQKIIQKLGKAIEKMLNNVGKVARVAIIVLAPAFKLIKNISSFISSNWSIIAPIIAGIVVAFILYNAVLAAHAIAVGISTAAEWLHSIAAYAQAQALLANVNANLLATNSEYALAVATAQATVAQAGFNTALLACPITWIILAIIIVIALVYAICGAISRLTGITISGTGIICAMFMLAFSIIGNIIIALANMGIDVIALIWNNIAKFAEFFANVFNDPIGSVVRLFANMADSVLSILETIAAAIDTLFGSNLAGAVQGWRGNLKGAVKDLVGEAEIQIPKLDPSIAHLKGFNYTEQVMNGYKFGKGIDDKISGMFSKGRSEDKKDYEKLLESLSNSAGTTAGNTGDIKNSLDMAEEDLKYLRDVAEREVINRFTTAELKIEMNNNNKIDSELDIDGIVDKLSKKVEEELSIIAEGVYT